MQCFAVGNDRVFTGVVGSHLISTPLGADNDTEFRGELQLGEIGKRENERSKKIIRIGRVWRKRKDKKMDTC